MAGNAEAGRRRPFHTPPVTTGRTALLTAILLPPTAWSLHIVVDYVLTSRACAAAEPNVTLLDRPALWPAVAVVHLVTLAAIAVTGLVALRHWHRAARHEEGQPPGFLLDVGEGYRSFLAHWGLLMSIGFFGATLFDTVVLPFIRICG